MSDVKAILFLLPLLLIGLLIYVYFREGEAEFIRFTNCIFGGLCN